MSEGGLPNLTSLKIENPHLRDAAAFIGEVARPFAIIAISTGAAVSIVRLSDRLGAGEAAIFIGAVLAGLGALYWGKAWEKVAQIKKGGQ
jgi:hypothetical protein